jgi:hypothetical protein
MPKKAQTPKARKSGRTPKARKSGRTPEFSTMVVNTFVVNPSNNSNPGTSVKKWLSGMGAFTSRIIEPKDPFEGVMKASYPEVDGSYPAYRAPFDPDTSV